MHGRDMCMLHMHMLTSGWRLVLAVHVPQRGQPPEATCRDRTPGQSNELHSTLTGQAELGSSRAYDMEMAHEHGGSYGVGAAPTG